MSQSSRPMAHPTSSGAAASHRSRDDTDAHLTLTHVGAVAPDSHGAGQRRLAAATPRLPIDRRDGRLWHRLQRRQRASPRSRLAFDRLAPTKRSQTIDIGVTYEVGVDASRQPRRPVRGVRPTSYIASRSEGSSSSPAVRMTSRQACSTRSTLPASAWASMM